MSKNFCKVITGRSEEMKSKIVLGAVLKERKQYIEKQINAVEGDLAEAVQDELSIMEEFIALERKDGSGMERVFTSLLKNRKSQRVLGTTLEEYNEIKANFFEVDGEEFLAKFDITDED